MFERLWHRIRFINSIIRTLSLPDPGMAYRSIEFHKYNSIIVQDYKSIRVQGYKSKRVQKYDNTRVHGVKYEGYNKG